MIVADRVGTLLADLGVGRAFGVVGSGNFHVTNALRDAGVPYTAARHEGGAATMADAYARTSGSVGVLTVHQGCGLTNAMTGIAEAAKSRTPLLVLAAETGGAAVRSNFRVDQDALARAVGAVPERVHTAASAAADVVRAYGICRDQRRTVVLNLPLDVQAAEAVPGAVPARTTWAAPRPDPASVAALAELLDGAQRPVFIAGRGARGARAELEALADRCGALLATSAVAHGLFTGSPWSLGISGGFSGRLAASLIADADVVVAWGASLTMWTTRHGELVRDAVLAQVDDTPEALGAQRPVSLGVLGDVGATARDVLEVVWKSEGYRSEAVGRQLRAARHPVPDEVPGERIDPRLLSAALDELLPAERTVAVDSGNFMGYPSAYLQVPDEAGFCFTQGFQSIGLGLATGIGAALARPDRLAVAACGDGGFLMGIAELETAVRLGLGMVVVLYDDAGYGAEFHHFAGADHDTVRFPDTDLAAIARGYGCDGAVVRSRADLAALHGWLSGPRDRPILLDAKITSDGPSWWLAEAFKGH
ncbi:acetolactate synthase I/II/III large subunit [Actinomycetospora sp. NBRC 106375]|uniref:thiamine pyrophosphate-binding protein n=1 Tax=Actinomycetospora sp. NBRC 106375 TaxID=3032207 RepID=UPI0024A2B154|nr:thiamine pyrophosphate-binding protein [Actinomycetospora sp. NBRC 106375]GLZ47860.1 acetolactate synthase I/II/III large subunit [Actinomycetospora sp. NBRC 106375]